MRRHFSTASLTQIVAATLVFAGGAWYELVHQTALTSIANADFWWHLRVGLGILATHTLPHTGLYSQLLSAPWMASSWLYDVIVALGYRWLDLRVVSLLAIVLKLALSVVVFVLAGGLRARFWTALALCAIVQYILIGMQPLPVCFSVLAFAIELTLLMQGRVTGSIKPLYWLPLAFLLWANLDVRFVYGIIALLLFVATGVIEQRTRRSEVSAPMAFNSLGLITGASIVTTFLTPYGWNLYGLFFSQATSAANAYFPDHQALRFRTPQDYLVLLLTMSAFLVLGMRRSRDMFQVGILVLCTALAFRAQADAWLVTVVAVAVLGSPLPQTTAAEQSSISAKWCLTAAGLAVALVAIGAPKYLPRGRQAMLASISRSYPVAAADYVRERQLPQPLFNSFPFGGFLTWYLPEYPVAIDGRTDLFGSDFNIQYAKAMNAEVHYSTFAPLSQAGTLILEKKSLMGKALPNVRGFKMVYSDDTAVVLVREES